MQDVAHIQTVNTTGPTTLAVIWGDGSVSHVDLAGWIARGGRRFAALGNALVFAGAAVGLYGGNVTWDDDEGDLAIDSEHLQMIAEHQAPFDAAAAACWQEDMRVSNVEAADLLGVAPSTWAAYKAGATIPATVARLCRAMRDEPTMLSAHLQPRTAGNPGKGPIYLDLRQEADLRWPEPRRITKPYRTLQEAVREFYRLPEEQQVRASVVLRGSGLPVVYKAAEIRRFRAMAPDDVQAGARSGVTT
jgi:hypothetical protein